MSGMFDPQFAASEQGNPLSNPEAELGLLGDLIANNALIDLCADRCRPNDFSVPLYGQVYARMLERTASGAAVDAVMLAPHFANDEGWARLFQVLSAAALNAGPVERTFVSLTPFARLLFMGLWGECDDMGSFEWSPLKLKMRILPADGVDAGDLLDELAKAGCIMRYEVAGRTYGAVRNFCQFQRPKKPNSVYPQTEAVRNWVGTEERSKRDGSEQVRNSGGSGSEPVGNQLPTGGEKPRQMEDGDTFPIGKGAAAPPVDLRKVVFDEGVKLLTQSGQSARAARGLVAKWCKAHGEGATREALVSAGGRRRQSTSASA